MRKYYVLLSLLATLVIPSVAHAGCLAHADASPSYSPYRYLNSGGINCTSNNGVHYQLRLYLQAKTATGSFASVNLSNPTVVNFTNPPNNYIYTAYQYIQCDPYLIGKTQLRSKTVVENLDSGSVDTDLGASNNIVAACN